MRIHPAWAAFMGAILLATSGCAGSSSSSSAASSGPDSDAAPADAVCTPGMDQTCNDSAEISSLHGACKPDGTCECQPQFPKNPKTGRCQ